MELFLLHFAGGNCYSYDFLKSRFGNEVDVYALELPGRGKRYKEKILLDKEAAVHDYVGQIQKLRDDSPYIIYGHSMGATLGFLVANQMEKRGDSPIGLVVSGNPGPGVEKVANKQDVSFTKKYLLHNDELKKVLRELGGIPEEIVTNNELFNYFSPIIRADFQVLEEGENIDHTILLNTPIHALMGSNEKHAHEVENWKNYTSSSFKFQIFPGNHFFIHDYPDELIGIIQSYYHQKVLKT